jgi:hypothetical protein
MAGRHDVFSIRANGAACPSFAKHVLSATSSGVLFMGHKVRWGEGLDLGKAFDAGPVPIEAPTSRGRRGCRAATRERKEEAESRGVERARDAKEPEGEGDGGEKKGRRRRARRGDERDREAATTREYRM